MSDELNNGDVERVLAGLKDPETGRSALQLDQIRDIQLNGTDLSLTQALTTHSALIWDDVRSGLEEQLRNSLPQFVGHNPPNCPRAPRAETRRNRTHGQERDRGGVGQRRCPQEHYRHESRPGVKAMRLQSAADGYRRLRPQRASPARPNWQAAIRRKQAGSDQTTAPYLETIAYNLINHSAAPPQPSLPVLR